MKDLTIKEQIELCSGKDEWHTKDMNGIPSAMLSDGPNGLRKQIGKGDMLGMQEAKAATCFPTASIAACSFDEELLEEYGNALGREAAAESVAVVLGPGLNIKRNPLCGRNFEYFSEDPYLSGKLGAAYIRGVQKNGVSACAKHFGCNSQEYFRMTSDSLIDERTLREIYLSAFEIAVKEGKPGAVMGAYNKINGTYCCSDRLLLTDILRNEWGFDGLVVTDWTAVEDRTKSFLAGCDLVMPGGNAYGEEEALENVKAGLLPESAVTASAARVAALAQRAASAVSADTPCDRESQHAIACRIAEESAVLLKNENGLLPLADFSDTVLIGQMAEQMRYQGFGSSKINPAKLEQFRAIHPDIAYAQGYREDGSTTDELIAEAAAMAKEARTAIIFAGLPGIYESEGYDRRDMKLPEGHNRLIEAVLQANPSVIVVLCCGSAVELPWADRVPAILYMGLSGQAGALAAEHLLLGKADPCGKLAETWPVNYEDCVCSSYYLGDHRDAQYREGIYVGYRYYEKAGVKVRFPFGYGLSYTSFAFRDLKTDPQTGRVSVTVTNTGARAGKESVLLYVHGESEGVYRPVRELKGFRKLFLNPGESKTAEFTLTDRSFSIWEDGWHVKDGDYEIEICGSAGVQPLKQKVHRQGSALQAAADISAWYLSPEGSPSEKDWESIYRLPIPHIPRKPFTIDSNIYDMLPDSAFLRLLYRIYERQQAKQFGRGSADYKGMMIMADECPLRSVQNNVLLKHHAAQALADIGNKKYISAVKHFFK